ncbi:MAG TPA: multicopper oxidase domain-containing protein [Candidatus Limnocylindria bacterium]|nr:multicopper oxidase domain-containing protein [Candidatus Limnocylindria bacterium]
MRNAARAVLVASATLVLVAGATLVGTPAAALAATRHYYVQAEDVSWDFAPTGEDRIHGDAIPAPWTRYTIWAKTRYIEYTDATFSVKKEQPPWLGVLGPIIRAEVGDTVLVHFRNRASGSYGMHPHGFRYDKDSEGAHYEPAGAGAQIPPGGEFTYTWIADADSGPGPNDPSSLVWWYHSHVDEPAETNAGLLGPIVITGKGQARADATPIGIDREFVLAFFIFDEDEGRERGLMHAINGYIFGNLPGITMRTGDKVRWYVLGMGNEVDLHTVHWHGKTLARSGSRTDAIELLPGSMATADMTADNPGTWLIHCHVADHIYAGMLATYTITR